MTYECQVWRINKINNPENKKSTESDGMKIIYIKKEHRCHAKKLGKEEVNDKIASALTQDGNGRDKPQDWKTTDGKKNLPPRMDTALKESQSGFFFVLFLFDKK